MRKRNLSEFMCIEMLYDYKSEKLDSLRTQAVEEGLETSAKVREEFNKLSVGLSYCDKLKNVKVSDALVNLILDQPKTSEKIISRFRWYNLPQAVRWTIEAVVVAVAVALFVTQVPNLFKDEKIEPNTMLVKKFDIKPPEEEVETPAEPTKEAYKAPEEVPLDLVPVDGTAPQKVTEKVAEKAPETKPEVVEKKPEVVASKEIPMLLKPTPKTVEAPVATPAPKIATAVEAPATEAESTAKAAVPAKKGNAYLYRMTMYVDDVDTVTPEIVNLVSSLEGQKAGEVELGWRRKGGSYFHFSVPEVNSSKLQEGLKKYAPFNIVKSPHPRVMPEGTERYILWVEKKAAKEESQDDSEETQSSGTTAPEDNTQGTSQENNEAN